MINNATRFRVLSGLLWKLLERSGTQGVQFIVQLVLARILLPEDYGLIALISIFINVANIFVQSGFNSALIQKKDADETDFSSVFYLSLLVAGILYVSLYFGAPAVADFYGNQQIISLLRVLSLTLFFGVFNSIQNAIVSRRLQFKMVFVSSVSAMVVSGTIGIVMAYMNYGVWALVGQQVSNQFLVTLILWFKVKWRPGAIFSLEKLKELFSYGWKLLVAALLNAFYMDLRSLIIGKIFDTQILGQYNRGKQFPAFIVGNINGSIQAVMFPTFSSQQDNKQRVKNMVRRSIVIGSFFLFPLMVGLALTAEPLIKVLLTDKWLPCVPFLQIYCASYAFYPIHTANLQAINALGRSDVFLKLEVLKKIIGLLILGITLSHGVYAIAMGEILSSFISTFINAYPNKKLLDYGYIEQFVDIIPFLSLSIIMGIIVYSVRIIELSSLLTLIIQILLGIGVYLALAKIFRIECMNYLVEIFRGILAARRDS